MESLLNSAKIIAKHLGMPVNAGGKEFKKFEFFHFGEKEGKAGGRIMGQPHVPPGKTRVEGFNVQLLLWIPKNHELAKRHAAMLEEMRKVEGLKVETARPPKSPMKRDDLHLSLDLYVPCASLPERKKGQRTLEPSITQIRNLFKKTILEAGEAQEKAGEEAARQALVKKLFVHRP